jgi:hypothetical protein
MPQKRDAEFNESDDGSERAVNSMASSPRSNNNRWDFNSTPRSNKIALRLYGPWAHPDPHPNNQINDFNPHPFPSLLLMDDRIFSFFVKKKINNIFYFSKKKA